MKYCRQPSHTMNPIRSGVKVSHGHVIVICSVQIECHGNEMHSNFLSFVQSKSISSSDIQFIFRRAETWKKDGNAETVWRMKIGISMNNFDSLRLRFSFAFFSIFVRKRHFITLRYSVYCNMFVTLTFEHQMMCHRITLVWDDCLSTCDQLLPIVSLKTEMDVASTTSTKHEHKKMKTFPSQASSEWKNRMGENLYWIECRFEHFSWT